MGLIIAFLICWTPVELIALIHFTGKAGMLCENACRTAKNVRNGFTATLTKNYGREVLDLSESDGTFETLLKSYFGMALFVY